MASDSQPDDDSRMKIATYADLQREIELLKKAMDELMVRAYVYSGREQCPDRWHRANFSEDVRSIMVESRDRVWPNNTRKDM